MVPDVWVIDTGLSPGMNPGALFTTWISNYIHYKVWDKITYPSLNFNGAAVEVMAMEVIGK